MIAYHNFRKIDNKDDILLRSNVKHKENLIINDININKLNSIYYPSSRDLNIIEIIFPYLYKLIKYELITILNSK